MVNTGRYKSDNGFKPGFLQHLEACLKESLPESGILAKPHIESRMRTMRKDWQAVYDLLNTSGFGYDKERNCVTTNAPGVWDAYLENHKHAGKWKEKSLPHYEELCIIFGKDRAQGNRAKSVVEMEQEVNMEEQENQRDDDFGEHSHNENTNASSQFEETSSGRSKKRKRTSQVNTLFQGFNDAVVQFGDRLKETSAELSEDIKFELDIKKKTLMIPSELSKMTSLNQLERFTAIDIIKDDQNRVMTFWTLGEEEREAWVRFMLSKFG
ncbi:putative Myb/SANT-like domain-containing protein [Helianthus annuus]|uniref:uncharacterized protein At2g29880-like n=1 Tax=Helianthus annuus TaxID=4232 RepID=UPI000B903D8D|nr:uncharacterized protein At2g29880-like [Helianthus annuus]XP_035836830.1 uncharacterized protein At2g29880-like [Helianthus annuus]KAJ0492934.1 putative Myb/SANT-like domain-containing protein [Helianthus annuus]